jgi:hypothetical protein
VNTSTIPQSAIDGAKRIAKRNPDMTFADVPKIALEAITAGPRGHYKPGLKCWIIGGEERTVFLGPDLAMVETKLPEFTLILESGGQFQGQYGRDFVFAP